MFSLLKKYCISIAVNSIVLTVCMIKPPEIESLPMTGFDKLVHSILFIGISGTVFFDNTGYLRRKISALRLLNGSLLFPVAFGGLIEILQATLTNTRSGDWMDFLYDVLGSVAGVAVCYLINRKLKANACVQ
jgi:VanZ family protein